MADIESGEVVALVEQFVEGELIAARKFDNKAVLDESGISDLHRLAARIFALGYSAGEVVTSQRYAAKHLREREAARRAEEVQS